MSSSEKELEALSEEGGYLTTKQAAAYLSVSVSSINKLREEGAFPFRKFGTIVRFQRNELDKYADSCALTFVTTGD